MNQPRDIKRLKYRYRHRSRHQSSLTFLSMNRSRDIERLECWCRFGYWLYGLCVNRLVDLGSGLFLLCFLITPEFGEVGGFGLE